MRLWHYKLLPVLPTKMLVSQWRECIAIKRQWEKGTLKHRLVSYVKNYNKQYFLYYVNLVIAEMKNRNIKYQQRYYDEFINFYNDKKDLENLFYKEHNDIYLRECLYNLEEKATRNIINRNEWEKVYNKFKRFTDLWYET